MKTFKKIFCGLSLLTSAFLGTSCVTESISDIEINERKANITLEQLQYKIRIANDTSKIRSFVMEQSLRAKGEDLFVSRISFLKPHYYKIETFKDSKLLGAELYNEKEVWSYNPKNVRYTKLEGKKKIARLAMLQATSTDDNNYNKFFSDIKLSLVDIEGKEYYKIIGTTKNDIIPPINIYVNKKTSMPEIIETKMNTKNGMIDYYAITKNFVKKSGAKFPNEQEIIIGKQRYKYKLEKLEVNIDLKIEDFEPTKPWYE